MAELLCPGCQKLERAQADLDKKKGAGDRHGAYIVLRRRSPD